MFFHWATGDKSLMGELSNTVGHQYSECSTNVFTKIATSNHMVVRDDIGTGTIKYGIKQQVKMLLTQAYYFSCSTVWQCA